MLIMLQNYVYIYIYLLNHEYITVEFIFLNLGSTMVDKTGKKKKLLLRSTKSTDFICYIADLFYYFVDFVCLFTNTYVWVFLFLFCLLLYRGGH